MNTIDSATEGRFYRDGDRAMLGGVCAGIAQHLGFNLFATRLVTVIVFFMTGPIMIVAYIAAVFLVPARSLRDYPYEVKSRSRRCRSTERSDRRAARRDARAARRDARAARREARRHRSDEAPQSGFVSERATQVREKCSELDDRLRELEKTVTSRKFQIDQELGRL